MTQIVPENLILLCGELLQGDQNPHPALGQACRAFTMKVILPGATDLLPMLIPEELITDGVTEHATVSVVGKLISEEVTVDGELRILLKILVQELHEGETEVTSGVFLTGNVIKKPYSYSLPDGERTELTVAVGDGDEVAYVPLAASGEVANTAQGFSFGEKVSILGQLHSIEYLSLGGDTDAYTAYEVEVLSFISLQKL